MEDTTPTLIAVGTRLPQDIYDQFNAICMTERRSMSAQMLVLVERFIKENQAQQVA